MIDRLTEVFKHHDAAVTHESGTKRSDKMLLWVCCVSFTQNGHYFRSQLRDWSLSPSNNCKTHIPYDEVLHIESCVEELTRIMNERGELSDVDFDRLGIRLVGDESSRNSLVDYRRRGCILTNYAFIKAQVDEVRAEAEVKAAKAAAALAKKESAKRRKDAKEKAKAEKAKEPGDKATDAETVETFTMTLPANLFKI